MAVATMANEICAVASVAGTAVATAVTELIGTATLASIMVASAACEPKEAVAHTVAASIGLKNVVVVTSITVVGEQHGAN